jgi:hypothetical protein
MKAAPEAYHFLVKSLVNKEWKQMRRPDTQTQYIGSSPEKIYI